MTRAQGPVRVIGGKVLDSTVLVAMAGRRLEALLVLDYAERTASTLLVPAPAVVDAYLELDSDEAAILAELLDSGVIVVDPLTADNAPAVAGRIPAPLLRAHEGRGLLALEVGHAALLATARGWPVVTCSTARWVGAEGVQVELINDK
ncbi:MAG: hypothetical protein L0Y54_05185 [Sporichthyaceae bacterium]|nr:hypothetical protein [Sporichthyaceae bacterium]